MTNLKELLQKNQIVELSNDNDVFDVSFSHIRNLFVLRQNGMTIRTFKSLKSLQMRLPSNLEVSDLF
jgi:hypothetical protein